MQHIPGQNTIKSIDFGQIYSKIIRIWSEIDKIYAKLTEIALYRFGLYY